MKPSAALPQSRSRRMLLQASAKLFLLGLAAALPGCSFLAVPGESSRDEPGLGALARRRGRIYGAAVQSVQIEDAVFADAVRQEAAMLVPETELKWNALRLAPQAFDFSGYRRLAAFARANDMAMRGHVLAWHYANPDWLEPALANRMAAEKILTTHITRVLGETAPMIRNWDVVNEAVDAHSARPDGLRETLWLKALGPDYVALAFRLAHAADPGLTLTYNDYGMERGDGDASRKRRCILRLLEKCRKDGVPVHALGLQSHLQAHRPLAGAAFTAFLKDVRALGLDIYITELDLDLSRLSGRADDKIRIAQNYLRVYLDMVQESGAIDMLLTWGLSDRYSWLRKNGRAAAGALPLTRDCKRGPMWGTLRENWLAARVI